jgi:hypothetical protein
VAKQTGWKRKGKQRDRVSFVITCREWKSLFEVKEYTKKEELVKMEKNKGREQRKAVKMQI